MTPDPVRAIADAVLYEGYILWPYRRSALKNQKRFTFGGVYPPAHAALHPDDPSSMQTEVLVTGGAVSVTVRFLQVVKRKVLDPSGREVDELESGGERHLAWDEAVEREIAVPPQALDALATSNTISIEFMPGTEREELAAGALLRSWHGLRGQLEVRSAPLRSGVWRLSAEIVNETPFERGGSRQDALARTFCSTHTLLRVHRGEFVSATDPPPELTDAAGSCVNRGTWPVLAGQPGDRTTVLSSPIILEDYPRVAPESPGDMFDGGEIDQLLILNILALTDEEKAEMAASDPRARAILERTQALTPEQLTALHGTLR
jgi:hypothetical protein